MDVSVNSVSFLRRRLNGHLEILDLRRQVRLLAVFLFRLKLVDVGNIDAEVLAADLVRLLLQDLRNHAIDRRIIDRHVIDRHVIDRLVHKRDLIDA